MNKWVVLLMDGSLQCIEANSANVQPDGGLLFEDRLGGQEIAIFTSEQYQAWWRSE